jgi:serine/threonine protein phosphatase PrpC
MDSEWALVALIDGLGHGAEAKAAARVAADILTQEALLPLAELMSTCHEGLRGTRGVVMTVARFDVMCDAVEWCGVGNVEGVLLHTDPAAPVAREALITRGGVVGYRLPPLKICNARIWPGDLLVLASDGLRSGFSDMLQCDSQPESLANDLLARYGKGSDDALVLVVRYTGRR